MAILTGALTRRGLDIAAVVGDIARELDVTPAQVALAWLLHQPAMTAPIIGARTFAQFNDNLQALSVSLNDDHLARLEEASKLQDIFPHGFLKLPAM